MRFLRNFEAKIINCAIMKWNILNQPLGSVCPPGSPTKKEIAFTALAGLISAAIAAGSTAYGGAKSAQANREARERLAGERAVTEAERMRKKHESWTDTASGMNTIRKLQDMADQEYRRDRGAAVVGGATEAAVAAGKDLQNQKQAEIIADAVAAHEDKKDQVDASYRQQLRGLNQQEIALDQQKGQNIAQTAAGLGNSLAQTAAALGSAEMMGAGSPAGGATTPATVKTGGETLLQQMGTSSLPSDVQRQIGMQYYLGNNYSRLLNNENFMRYLITGQK